MNKKIVFLGFPGSGKGTQSALLVEKIGIYALSTGDAFRAMIKEGKGEVADKVREFMHLGKLVSDELTFSVVKESLDQHKDSWLLDGFPRNIHQADLLEAYNKPTDAVIFEMDEERIFKRLTGRRLAKNSGRMYNIYFNPPKRIGVCDISGESLVQRDDDQPETVVKRLEIFHKETMPLVEYYKEKGRLRRLNADQEMPVVFNDLKKMLGF